jgi:hypothetical protein
MSTLQPVQLAGWSVTNSEGIATVYLAIIDEGMTTGPGDTPANEQFKPRILNPEQFSIKRAPVVWFEGSTSNQSAAFGELQISNYDGAFDFLLSADLRDTTVIIKIAPAGLLLPGTTMADAMTIATAVIDSVSSDDEDTIYLQLKDTLARLDKTLPAHFNPPYVDEGAANVMVPMTFGACRNIKPLLVDSPNRLFQLHDAPISNVTQIADMAAPLDPNATPPQYTPALNNSGIQLETMPVGVLTAQCSSVGSQAIIPGVKDVLAGDGAFSGTWTGSPAVPPGWTFSHDTGSSINEINNPPNTFLGATAGATIKSVTPFDPVGSAQYGETLEYATAIFQPGVSYRVTFSLWNISVNAPAIIGGMSGGVVLAIGLTANASDYISGVNSPIAVGNFKEQNFTFEFTTPQGSARNLYFCFAPSEGLSRNVAVGSVIGTLFNVLVEQLGQYLELPLSGIPYDQYCTEILVNRAGEDPSIFNSAEAAAIITRADGTIAPIGVHFDAPPNILDALRIPLDSAGAVTFTDATGTLRFRRQVDPSDPANQGTIKAAFTEANIFRPIQVAPDVAQYLTTLAGSRRNWYVFNPSDFVSDQAIVPQTVKTQYSRNSQFWAYSSVTPAGQYANAINAPIFDMVWDLIADCQIEIDRVVSIRAPQIYSDGTIGTGKRLRITFTAFFDDPAAVGIITTAALNDILYGDIVTMYYPSHSIVSANGGPVFAEVVGWEPFPFAQKLTLTVLK